MAYGADQIKVNGIEVKQLEQLEIVSAPGDHGKLVLCGYLEGQNGEGALYGLTEQATVSVYADEALLFSGFIVRAKLSSISGTARIAIEAKSRSVLMDQRRRSRTFQDTSMTYGQLVKIILADYTGSDAILSIEDKPLGEIAVQYRETDWEFLKRMLSRLNAVTACRIASETLQLYGGVPTLPKSQWAYETKEYRKELGTYDYWLLQGKNVSDIDFFFMEIETDHMPELYEEVTESDKQLVIQSFTYMFARGALRCFCSLQKKEGILAPAVYPMDIIGVALEGKVLETVGTNIRIHLKIDDGNTQGDSYLFPFSTLSASPDGSGWYYMPEQGDDVRVYFPSKHTGDVIAVSAVSSYDGKEGDKPDRMGDPSSKYLSNPGGQQMKLAEDGVYLACRGDSASVKVGNDGAVAIAANHVVEIIAANNLSIEAEEAVSVQASEIAAVSCTKGGTLQMQDNGDLFIQGTEVKVD